ncbi:hypothetical protein KKF91_20110 [Myxococcota bacterium]|nr:hypothetical protein [Myxococcota bacterium]
MAAMSKITLTLLCAAALISMAHAAPEDRGLRGYYVGGGLGFALGQATDDLARDTGSFYGMSYHLRVGEEVLPRFSLGLDFLSAGGAGGNDQFDAGGGGFLLQAGWRPLPSQEGLSLLLGTGVGGFSVTGKNGGEYDGLVGGAMYQIAALYDIQVSGAPGEPGWSLAPSISALFIPTSSGEASAMIFSLGVDLTWFGGRG